MNKDKITIVSGEPRSGTSLMMQTLNALGLDIVGEKKPQEDKYKKFKDENGEWLPEYLDKKEDIERKIKHSEMMNPIGFYETQFVSTGVRGVEAEKFKGKVMKIITSGIPEHHGRHGMSGTSKKLIDKIILCVRNPKNIAVSQKNLVNETINISSDDGWIYHNDAPPSPLAYIGRTGSFIIWLENNMDIIKKILVVEYEDMLNKPKKQIEKIISFLDISPSEHQIEDAVSNVKPSLKRSKDFKEWPKQFKEDGELAMNIYEAVRYLNSEDITYTAALLKSREFKNSLENVRWVDSNDELGTWIIVDPSLFRNISINKNNVRDKLYVNAKGNDCTNCAHFSKSDKIYTVKRPEDLGDLERNMIWCKRDEDIKNVEQCYHCYTIGWKLNGEYLHPENKNKNKVLVNS